MSELVERSRGFGDKFHPREPEEAQEDLRPQVRSLEEVVETLPQGLRGSRVNFQAKLLPNYLAGSYFPSRLLSHLGLHYIGSRAATGRYRTQNIDEVRPTKYLILSGADSAIAAFSDLVAEEISEDTSDLWDDLRELSQVGMADVDQVVRGERQETEPEDVITWEAVLHQVAGETEREIVAEQDLIFDKWVAYIDELGGEVAEDYRRIVDGLTFVPVALPTAMIEETVEFNPLRAIRPMPEMRPTPVQILRDIGEELSPDPPEQDDAPVSDERLAVFDGGFERGDPYLSPYTDLIDLTPEDAEDTAVAHGTVVTNAILHGYIEDARALSSPAVAIDHYRVLPVPASRQFDLQLNWILDQIIDRVEENNYRLVNLSIGPNEAVSEDDEPHRWTAELDRLAQEEDVLFITAAGNNGENDGTRGLNRVQIPADMVNGVGVGSCDSRSENDWGRASYSAVGPGRWGARVRPTGVAFGGSEENPFVGLGPGGRNYETAGTSFSTPLSTHGLAGLLANLGRDEMTPHALRAFTVHFADRDDECELEEVGFGKICEKYGEIVNCRQNEVHVLSQGLIDRDEALGLWLPVPDSLPDGIRLNFRWTLCYTSDVYPSEVTDYTGSGVETTFRPHIWKYRMQGGSRSKVINVVEEEDEFLELTAEGAERSTNPVSESRGHVRYTEQARREAGKWETVLHQEFGKRSQSVHRPRLDLIYLSRERGRLTRDVDPLEFAFLFSLSARRDVDLYSRVRQEYEVLSPIAAEVEVRL